MISILHVDDEKVENQLLVRNFLKRSREYQINYEESANAALQLLEHSSFDVIISDFQMPGMDGLQFLRKLNEIHNETPFIFLTGQGNEELAIEALREGANDYFIKGFEFAHYERLMNSVQRVVKNRRIRKERQRIESQLFELEGRYRRSASNDENLKFEDIVDVNILQEIMDVFHNMTSSPLAILDSQDNILVASGWQDICTKFHRINPETRELCHKSDQYIKGHINVDKPVTYTCELGLTDCAYPIIISGQLVATLFTGQFFSDKQKIDRKRFLNQAVKYKFDQDEYLAALDSVPVFSRKQINHLKEFMVKFARIIASLGNANIRFAKELLDRRKKDKSLEKQTYFLKKAQEIGAIGTWEIDISNNVILWTEENCRIFGVPEGSALDYETFINIVHPDDRDYVNSEWSQAIQGKHYDIEHRILVDDKVKWVREKAEINRNEEGEAIWAVGVTQDITDKKIAELALKESEETFRLAFETNPDSINLNRLKDGRYVQINKGFTDLMGYTKEDVIGKTSLELDIWHNPQDREKLVEGLSKEGKVNNLEAEFEAKDGSVRTAIMSASVVKIHGEDHIISITRDITKRVEAQRKIRESELRHHTLLSNISDVIGILDKDGKTRYVSPNSSKIFGWSPEDLTGMDAFQGIHEDDRDIAKDAFNQIIQEPGKRASLQIRYLCKNGEVRLIDITGVNMADDPVINGILISYRDVTERIEARRQAEANQANYVDFLNNFKGIAYQGDMQFRPSFLLGAVEEITGYQEKDFTGNLLSWDELIHPEDISRVKQSAEEFKANSLTSFERLYRIIRKDKEVRWVRENISSIRDESGLPVRIQGTIVDITVQKELQEEKDKLLRDLNERVKELNCLYDLAKIVGNPGITLSEILQQTVEILPLSWQYTDSTSARITCNGEEYVTKGFQESRWCLKRDINVEGEVAGSVEIFCQEEKPEAHEGPFLKEECNLINAIAERLGRIAERYSFEEERKKEKELSYLISDKTSDSTWAMNKDLKFTYLSPSTEKLFGYSFEEWQTLEWGNFVHPDYLDPVMKAFTQIVEGKKVKLESQVCSVFHKDGSRLWVDFSATPIFDTDNNFVGVVGVTRDVTQKKIAEEGLIKAREELLESNKHLKTFSYTVSHDLRAPLRQLAGLAELLKMKCEDQLDADGKELLDEMSDVNEHMSLMVNSLLDLSRIQREKVYRQKINLREIANTVEMTLRQNEPGRKVEFHYSGDLEADADPGLITSVMNNLLGNAWKFTSIRDGAKIELSSTISQGKKVYYVKDNGVGFDPESAEMLFLPFRRLHSSDEFKGTGIGLATVKMIINRHGGQIWAESEKGKGATFYFTLSDGVDE